MVTLRCQDCGYIQENGQKKLVDDGEHKGCGGGWAVKDSDDDSYEPNECDHCKKDIGKEDSFDCVVCEDDNICVDCMLPVEEVNICKECVDKAYPRKVETVEKIVEKFVEVPKETIKVMGFSEPIL